MGKVVQRFIKILNTIFLNEFQCLDIFFLQVILVNLILLVTVTAAPASHYRHLEPVSPQLLSEVRLINGHLISIDSTSYFINSFVLLH